MRIDEKIHDAYLKRFTEKLKRGPQVGDLVECHLDSELDKHHMSGKMHYRLVLSSTIDWNKDPNWVISGGRGGMVAYYHLPVKAGDVLVVTRRYEKSCLIYHQK